MNVRAHRRGFTLVELMIATLIASMGVVVAANVAQVVVRQNQKAREVTDLSNRARSVLRQMRADLRVTGYGSTGAIALHAANWPGFVINTPPPTWGNYPAMPAVYGANATTVGGSDAIRLVVPLLATTIRTADKIEENVAPLALVPPLMTATVDCPGNLIYAVDHTNPNGAGRAQLLRYNNATRIPLDQFQFPMVPGSEIMCARLSTYWVDPGVGPNPTPWLRRHDWTPASPPLAAPPDCPGCGMRFPQPAFAGNIVNDGMAPGILNMQIAYRVSAEAFTQVGWGTAGQTGWAFAAPADYGDTWMGGPLAANTVVRWFEVRAVRINLLARSLRRITNQNGNETINLVEDKAAETLGVLRDLRAEWLSSSEALVNLRLFDLGAPPGVLAEPW